MSEHKKRPKLNEYFKVGVFSKKKKKIKFFSPALVYLTSKFSTRLKNYFQTTLSNRNKFKLIFGFYRTASLQKLQRQQLSKHISARRLVKENEFCSILERRLDVILFRLGFVSSLYEAKHLISHRKVRINNLPNACFSKLLEKGDIISFVPEVEDRLKKQIINQSKNRRFFFNTFMNLEVNYKTLKIILLTNKIILKKQLHNYSHALNWKMLTHE